MRIDHRDLAEVTRSILKAAGVDDAQARTVTDNLVWCDMAGRRNHGVERLSILLKRIAHGQIKHSPVTGFEMLSPSMARLMADGAFGHHAGAIATEKACDLAAEFGLGAVGVTDSNFFGAGAFYAKLAADRNMISLVLSNSFPKVAAPGGLQSVLGTNPFAFGAPRRNGYALLVDMSTASVAGSTVREKMAKGESFPEGVAIDGDGAPITDPSKVLAGTLLTAAGAKGYGLALMVEVLSGVLTGAGMSHQVASMYKDFDRNGQNGHFILALDVRRWMPMEEYFTRMEFLTKALFESGEDGAVRLPGDSRWKCYEESLANGVTLERSTLQALEGLARDHNVDLPWVAVATSEEEGT